MKFIMVRQNSANITYNKFQKFRFGSFALLCSNKPIDRRRKSTIAEVYFKTLLRTHLRRNFFMIKEVRI